MTRLRPLVVPVAALTLATATPSASAQQPRRSVTDWAASPTALTLAADHATLPSREALVVQPATSLPVAALDTPAEVAADPAGWSATAAPPASAVAAGRPLSLKARGPP